MRLSEAPLDQWMEIDSAIGLLRSDDYQACRRRDGWYEFRWDPSRASVFSRGVLTWEDLHEFWVPVAEEKTR